MQPDAPDQLSLKLQFMGGNMIKSDQQFKSTSSQKRHFSHDLMLAVHICRQYHYLDSAGVSGPIPSTFANLRNMVTVWASDNAFTGRIPDFIGNWTQLQTLRFEGNSFEGSMPPTFSRLTSLQELRISGLSNGTLDFIRDMKSLSTLCIPCRVLRNNRLSGSIPTDIGEYQSLTRLDLSFNRLSGQIPRGLFNVSQIAFL
ncbi:hypothetical protein OSB04_023716 [Centaurea solstitialis]|uniref:Uncharacterized protein n=1 Tax=Centaurea solstitialis TaxID=347529 RepID=A0AA38WBD6_9ASTR|nr:hypothetical protein OSB04_023716 [Centaurea solstitialis]